MTIRATSALAVPFAWASSGASDVTVEFATSPSTVSCAIPGGTYRISLAPSASDFLRVIQSAVNAALTTAGRAERLTVAITEEGLVTLTFSGAITRLSVGADLLGWILGFEVSAGVISSGAVGTLTAKRQPWYLAFFTSLTEGVWSPMQAGGAEVTTGGAVFAVAASSTWYERADAARFIPWSQSFATTMESRGTPMFPAEEYTTSLGSVAVDRAWTILDVLQVARNTLCAVTIGQWATVRVSTTQRFVRAYVGPRTLLSPALSRQDPAWEGFVETPLHLVRPASGDTETRA